MALSEDMTYCSGCGKEIHSGATSCPFCGRVQGAAQPVATGPGMTFGEAVKTCLVKYVVFEGRATRPEYWYFYLFTLTLSLGATVLQVSESVSGLITLAFLLPSLTATSRRLHDMGRSGWNQLWTFTVIGIIPVIYWLTRPTQPAPNRYGPQPGADFKMTQA